MNTKPETEVIERARSLNDKEAVGVVIDFFLKQAKGSNGRIGLNYDAEYKEIGADIFYNLVESFMKTLREGEDWINHERTMGSDVGYDVEERRLHWNRDKDLLKILMDHL